MMLLLIAILIIIIFILAVMCIHRSTQVYSLKRQVNFLEYSLEQLAEKEKGSKQGPERKRSEINHNK
jgi:predicted Holliday junction resolvase-like endonuclease